MKRKVAMICCLLWMGFIFYQSSRTGDSSNEISHEIVNQLANPVKQPQPVEESTTEVENQEVKNSPSFEKLNVLIRKSAHAFEFLVLALLLGWVLSEYEISSWKLICFTMLGVLLYAASDEFHQLFVEGRTARLFDVMIDCIGGLIGILLFETIRRLKKKDL